MKKREDYAADLEQFHDLIRQMEDHKASLEKKVNEKREELLLTNNQLASKTRIIDEMKRTISNQEISVDGIRKLESDINEMKQTFEHKFALKEQRRKNLQSREGELVKFCFEVDSTISNYNSKLVELMDLPEINAKAGTMRARFDKENLLLQEQTNVVGVEVQSDVIGVILSCRDEYIERHTQVNEKFHDDLDTLDEMENRRKIANDKLYSIVEKKTKLEQGIENEINAMNVTLSVRQGEVSAIEAKVSSLHDPASLEKQMASYERQCSDLDILRAATHDEYILKKRTVASEIIAACQAMKEYDSKTTQIVAEAKKVWQQKSVECDKLVSIQYVA